MDPRGPYVGPARRQGSRRRASWRGFCPFRPWTLQHARVRTESQLPIYPRACRLFCRCCRFAESAIPHRLWHLAALSRACLKVRLRVTRCARTRLLPLQRSHPRLFPRSPMSVPVCPALVAPRGHARHPRVLAVAALRSLWRPYHDPRRRQCWRPGDRVPEVNGATDREKPRSLLTSVALTRPVRVSLHATLLDKDPDLS